MENISSKTRAFGYRPGRWAVSVSTGDSFWHFTVVDPEIRLGEYRRRGVRLKCDYCNTLHEIGLHGLLSRKQPLLCKCGKTCPRCKEFKKTEEYHRRQDRSGNRQGNCMQCSSEKSKERRKSRSPEERARDLQQALK